MADYIIDFQVKKNGQGRINVDGNPEELLTGILTMTKSLYQQIRLIDEEDAEWFLEQIGKAMVCPDHPLYKEVRENE